MSNLILEFRKYAIEKHGDQKYGDQPYEYHLEKVVDVLLRFNYRQPEMLMAGYGHDLLEDTNATREEIRSFHLPEVYDIIDGVTDLDKYDNESRAENKARTFLTKTSKNKKAIVIKMADRIANIEACLMENKPKILEMYMKEYTFFATILKGYMVDKQMFGYLTTLDAVSRRFMK